MPFFSRGTRTIPGIDQDIGRLYGIADRASAEADPGLGFAGRQAKGLLKRLGQGRYDEDPLIQAYLSPITDARAVARRENERSAGMGANALFAGQQPVLNRRLTDLANARTDEGTAQAISQMIPALYGQAADVYGGARGQRISAYNANLARELAAIESAIRARLGGTRETPSGLERIGQIGQFVGGLAGI